MKKLIKRSLCVLISAVIVFSTITCGFLSYAEDSSHYIDNVNFIETNVYDLEDMWDNDETFIFVLYSSYQDLSRDIGTNVIEKYWMNKYNVTVYGVDVFDERYFGNAIFDCEYGDPVYQANAASNDQYEEYHAHFHCPKFIKDRYTMDPNYNFFDMGYYNANAIKTRSAMPFPIIGFVIDGEFMTFDLCDASILAASFERDRTKTPYIKPQANIRLAPYGDIDPYLYYDYFMNMVNYACYPLVNQVFPVYNLYEPSDTAIEPSRDKYETALRADGYYYNEYKAGWKSSDFIPVPWAYYENLPPYDQYLFDLNIAFFTFLGENPAIHVHVIPPAADIDPGETIETLGHSIVAAHESTEEHDKAFFQRYDGSGNVVERFGFNFDGVTDLQRSTIFSFVLSGVDNNAAGLGLDPFDDDYKNVHSGFFYDGSDVFEDDYYDFSENNINRNLVWTSSDPSKVTVDQNGVIKAVTPFPCEVTITCSAVDDRLAPWDDFLVYKFPINVIPHDWDIQILPGDEATCTEDGIRTYTCREEGCRYRHYVYTEVIPKATAHTPAASYTPVPGHVANCLTETNGQEQLLCTECGAVIATREVSWQNAHIWVRTQVSTRTCTQDGVSHEECSRCHAIKPNSEIRVYATGHVPSSEYSYLPGHEPTCTEDGQEATFCTVCNQPLPSTTRTVPALGHDWGESYEDANGDQVHECIRCHIIESAELSFWERVVQFFRELFASIFGAI